uniref:Oclussion derived viral envelope 66 protein n=1 Tax=Lymantria dispar multicapsid nuclear polyhedrosis virus TaxID=10449 RepID=A0A1B1MQZ5_NPVLD|nr:oclussion derived viral envelope 66 protein [Lymantria dispar multiple nucleopolyhedrovirus]
MGSFVSAPAPPPSPSSSAARNNANRVLRNLQLDEFERYYLTTLQEKFSQKAEKIANPTRQFSQDGNVFVGLSPWSSPSDFGTCMHTLIGYGVRFRTPADALYLQPELAYNLYAAVVELYYHLPFPAPINQAPWGPPADWYHFSITMPECVQNTCIVLRGFYDLTDVSRAIIDAYLPLPTVSMGWQRTAGNAMRMCLPYCYGQLLAGLGASEIQSQAEVSYVLDLIAFPRVDTGNGIHLDYVYFDHTDVRAYGYLINSYFTFSYYNFLFGSHVVNMDNLYRCISKVGSARGVANPAVLSRNGSQFSNVLGHFIAYADGVESADFSKVLTVRTARYFGSVVGQAPGVAYYEADPTNNTHAALWAMTRKIWPADGIVYNYRAQTLGFESGLLLATGLNEPVVVPTTTTSTSSFLPSLAHTGIVGTQSAGAMFMHVRLEELNLEFHSYTLYHAGGMFQLYDNIKTLTPVAFNPRCVVLAHDTVQDPGTPLWTAASNLKTYNGTTAKHHNITNAPSLSNFVIRTLPNNGLQLLEQIISAETINAGLGVSCFSLLVASGASGDTTNAIKMNANTFVISTQNNAIQLVVCFPVAVLKDENYRQLTINDATANRSTSTATQHLLPYEKIRLPLSFLSLTVHNLKSDHIVRTDEAFLLHSSDSNQFQFSY